MSKPSNKTCKAHADQHLVPLWLRLLSSVNAEVCPRCWNVGHIRRNVSYLALANLLDPCVFLFLHSFDYLYLFFLHKGQSSLPLSHEELNH